MMARDFSHEMQKPNSLALRFVFAGLGTVFAALGLAGVFLPVLPTTPFLLLSAACFARASTRIYNWLLNHTLFGPVILEWRQHRAVPYRTKRVALALLTASMAGTIVFFLEDWRAQSAMTIFGVALGIALWRMPSRDEPPHRK